MSEENQENLEEQEAGQAIPAEEEAVKDEAPQVEEKKEPTAEEKLEELNSRYLRLMADFDNYRKRMARETNEIRERSKMLVVSDFLPVFDFFQMAMQHSTQTEDFKALKQGMDMIMGEFKRAFDGLGIQEIPAEGQPFDPQFHEAAQTQPSEDVPEGIILKQWKAGYKIGEKLLRPSMVVVSSGPEKKQETPGEEN